MTDTEMIIDALRKDNLELRKELDEIRQLLPRDWEGDIRQQAAAWVVVANAAAAAGVFAFTDFRLFKDTHAVRIAKFIQFLASEVKRLKDGNLTPQEFQQLCHNLHQKGNWPCTREEFEEGCRTFTDELFGRKEIPK